MNKQRADDVAQQVLLSLSADRKVLLGFTASPEFSELWKYVHTVLAYRVRDVPPDQRDNLSESQATRHGLDAGGTAVIAPQQSRASARRARLRASSNDASPESDGGECYNLSEAARLIGRSESTTRKYLTILERTYGPAPREGVRYALTAAWLSLLRKSTADKQARGRTTTISGGLLDGIDSTRAADMLGVSRHEVITLIQEYNRVSPDALVEPVRRVYRIHGKAFEWIAAHVGRAQQHKGS